MLRSLSELSYKTCLDHFPNNPEPPSSVATAGDYASMPELIPVDNETVHYESDGEEPPVPQLRDTTSDNNSQISLNDLVEEKSSTSSEKVLDWLRKDAEGTHRPAEFLDNPELRHARLHVYSKEDKGANIFLRGQPIRTSKRASRLGDAYFAWLQQITLELLPSSWDLYVHE